MGDIKSSLKSIEKTMVDIQLRISEANGKAAGLEGKLSGVEGRIAGVDAKVGALPSTWTLLGIIFTTWGLGSGLLIFTITRLLNP